MVFHVTHAHHFNPLSAASDGAMEARYNDSRQKKSDIRNRENVTENLSIVRAYAITVFSFDKSISCVLWWFDFSNGFPINCLFVWCTSNRKREFSFWFSLIFLTVTRKFPFAKKSIVDFGNNDSVLVTRLWAPKCIAFESIASVLFSVWTQRKSPMAFAMGSHSWSERFPRKFPILLYILLNCFIVGYHQHNTHNVAKRMDMESCLGNLIIFCVVCQVWNGIVDRIQLANWSPCEVNRNNMLSTVLLLLSQ